jgi:hypothetical protein
VRRKKSDPDPIEQPPVETADDNISLRTKPGWEEEERSLETITLRSTTNSVGTRSEWHSPTITSEQARILGENIRYRLMALVLELPNMSSKKPSDQSDLESSKDLETLSNHSEFESSKKSLEEISTDTESESLKKSSDLIVTKVIEWGQTWPQHYTNASLSNIIKNINDWFNSFTASGMHNDVAVIIKSLIYDCFSVFQETYKITSLLNDLTARWSIWNNDQILIAQIKQEKQFASTWFGEKKKLGEQKKIYFLYRNIFQRLGNVYELVSEFINHYPQAGFKNDTGETSITKCSPCCSIQ